MTQLDKCISLEAASEKKWDAIIVGSGMGGGAVAFKLANAGLKVLLVEKGRAGLDPSAMLSVDNEITDSETRLSAGRWPYKLSQSLDGLKSDFWAPLGCGVGGSTLLYAAALQRLRPVDFSEQELPDGRKIEWPYSYRDIEPYYTEAEKLFLVSGTPDPLDDSDCSHLLTPPTPCERDQLYFSSFQECGLNPYNLHVGIHYRGNEVESKRNSLNTFISPALETGNLHILERAEALEVIAEGDQVRHVLVECEGEKFTLEAGMFVLSAGAYISPALLKKSISEDWPNGLGNHNDLVGRNLMFHASTFISVWPPKKSSTLGPNKTIGVRDLYENEGEKLGEFQSTGSVANYGNILYALRLMFDQSRFRNIPVVGELIRQLLRIPAFIACKILGEASVFATIVEDFPYHENRITLDDSAPSGILINYGIKGELRDRALKMRKLIQKRMKKLYSLPIGAGVSLNYGHPCGTCAAGNDSSQSVVDKNCKVHGVKNLYVVDGSFMPTSGGTNPSLTIAANGLRVGDAIVAEQT